MGCNCNRRRQKAGAYAVSTAPPAEDEPVIVEFTDGSTQEYASRLEAHAAIMLAGGGHIK